MVLALLIAAASFLAIGCGGGSAGSSSTVAANTGPLTKAQFVKEAERICKKGLEEKDETVQAALEEIGSEPNYTAAQLEQKREAMAEGLLPYYRAIASGMGELQAPAKDKAAAAAIVAKMNAGLAKAEANLLSLLETNVFAAADEAARAYGFASCSAL